MEKTNFFNGLLVHVIPECTLYAETDIWVHLCCVLSAVLKIGRYWAVLAFFFFPCAVNLTSRCCFSSYSPLGTVASDLFISDLNLHQFILSCFLRHVYTHWTCVPHGEILQELTAVLISWPLIQAQIHFWELELLWKQGSYVLLLNQFESPMKLCYPRVQDSSLPLSLPYSPNYQDPRGRGLRRGPVCQGSVRV